MSIVETVGIILGTNAATAYAFYLCGVTHGDRTGYLRAAEEFALKAAQEFERGRQVGADDTLRDLRD